MASPTTQCQSVAVAHQQQTNKKRRWTKQEKEQHAAAKEQPKRPRTPPKTIVQYANESRFTGSVHVLYRDNLVCENGDFEISIYCRYRPRPPRSMPATWIHVQPLLILDLNGILCHRIRKHNGFRYRKSIAKIANTPIVPRTLLENFLNFLDAHFTLAVWTSAKPKTANKLVNILIPPYIRDRLLFVWAQNKCHSINVEGEDKPLFSKPLNRVWQQHPLWNTDNTLLMDDSPDKCPEQFSQNALHPPPLHGRQESRRGNNNGGGLYGYGTATNGHGTTNASNATNVSNYMSDLENEELQMQFFQRLARAIDDSNGRSVLPLLERFAKGHMGWRGPTSSNNDE